MPPEQPEHTSPPAARFYYGPADGHGPWIDVTEPLTPAPGEDVSLRLRATAPLPASPVTETLPLRAAGQTTRHDRHLQDMEKISARLRELVQSIAALMQGVGAEALDAAETLTDAFTEPEPDRPGSRRPRRAGTTAQHSPYGPSTRRSHRS